MSDLRDQVEQCGDKLSEVSELLSYRRTGTAIPSGCFEHWETTADLYSALRATIPLFSVRERAWRILGALAGAERIDQEDERVRRDRGADADGPVSDFSFDGVPMEFGTARHLAVTGYVCAVWALYDRLANVCGRLATGRDIPVDRWSDPKLWGSLMGDGGKGIGGFQVHRPLAYVYEWPTAVAYRVRNWVVHDGGDEGRGRLFQGSRAADGFLLHHDAVTHLAKCCHRDCQDDGRVSKSRLRVAEDPWDSHDLLKILEKYHAEVDCLFASLLEWTVDSFVSQITAFATDDWQDILAAGAAVRGTAPA